MRNMLKELVCGFAIMLLANIAQAHAGIIVSNLNATVDGTSIVSSGLPFAQEFTTGSQGFELASIVASLGGATGSFTASAELVADSSGLPGNTIVATFTVPSIGSSYDDVAFTSTANVTLSANTNYWFILSATGSGSYQWNYTNTLDSSLPNWAQSIGGVWSIGSPPGPFLIEVNSVPEPSSSILIALGIPAIAITIRRRLASIV